MGHRAAFWTSHQEGSTAAAMSISGGQEMRPMHEHGIHDMCMAAYSTPKFSTDLDSKLLGFQVCSHVLQLPVEERLSCGADLASLQTQQGLWDRPG